MPGQLVVVESTGTFGMGQEFGSVVVAASAVGVASVNSSPRIIERIAQQAWWRRVVTVGHFPGSCSSGVSTSTAFAGSVQPLSVPSRSARSAKEVTTWFGSAGFGT